MKKAAVIGLGDIAPIHIGAIAANDEIELCAVCDINPAAKERAPQGIPFYTDYKEMMPYIGQQKNICDLQHNVSDHHGSSVSASARQSVCHFTERKKRCQQRGGNVLAH